MSEIGLPRTRLLTFMDAGEAPPAAQPAPVIEVCAPAGYGKSTLLAQYARLLRDRATPVGWVTCDRHDADLPRWWTAVLTALSTSTGPDESGNSFAGVFDALEPPHTVEPAFLAEFVEAVSATGTVMTLVLDDLHELPDGAVMATLADLVRSLPPTLHLLLGTRRDPGIPLHRLKLEGRLREIRARELRFDREETRAVLGAFGVALTEDLLNALWQRTEGWPAATRLATLAIADQDPAGFVEHFAGDDRGVADYLVAEILDRQPDDIVRFLLDTCVAEELTVELANRLSGRADAGAILERLEHANALVQRLGRTGDWYRFHALLRSYLLAELRRRDLVAARTQHLRAARWFADTDEPAPALEHAVAGGGDGLVRDLLVRHGLRLLLAGWGQRLRAVLAGCSEAMLADPEVLGLVAVVALEDGDLAAGEQALARLGAAAEQLGGRAAGLYRLALLCHARLQGAPPALDEPEVVLVPDERRPVKPDAVYVELLTLANQAGVRIATGDYPGARNDLRSALTLSRREGLDHLTLDCLNQLGGATIGLSEVHEAGEWTTQAISFAGERGWASSPRLAYAHLLAAWRAHLALDPDEASAQASVAMALVQAGRVEPEVEIATRSGEAVIAFDRLPQRPDALRRFERVWETLAQEAPPSPALIGFASLSVVRMCLDLAEREHAVAVVRRVEKALPGHGDAAVLHALTVIDGRPPQASAMVAPVLSGERPTSVVTVRMTAWLIEALAAERAGRVEAAHRALFTALADGARTRVMRPFYDLGHAVHDMLVAVVGRAGPREGFLEELLAAWTDAAEKRRLSGSAFSADPGSVGPAELVAPLTRREIELLRDLPSLLTTEGIAEQHTLSVNTVKSHLRSLYRKLGAGNRREAVLTARRMSLL